MKSYTITVNVTAYEVTVEEEAFPLQQQHRLQLRKRLRQQLQKQQLRQQAQALLKLALLYQVRFSKLLLL